MSRTEPGQDHGSLLYDADCGFCTRSAALLVRLGARCRVVPLDAALIVRHTLPADRVAHEVPFAHADGRIEWGADAIAAALRTCPAPTSWLGCLLRVQPVRAVAGWVYRRVSANRHRLPGSTGRCAI